jgi:lipopolysaccharide export system protein LptA
MRILTRGALILLILLSAVPAAIAAEDTGAAREGIPGLPESLPQIETFKLIHADSMTLTRQKDKPQVFEGAVDIVLIDKDGTETGIAAEKITAYYEPDLREISRIEAEGRVKVRRLDAVATTELAVYRADKRLIELLESPHVRDARGELSANKITVHLDTNDVVAVGNVRGIVYPAALEETGQ